MEPQPIEDVLSQSEYIAQLVVVGQDRKTLGALIVPAGEAVCNALAAQGQTIGEDVASWISNDAVQKLFKNEIKSRVSDKSGFKAFEKVTTFALLPNEFQIGDELTQTLKVKRNVVFEKYAKEIDGMYN